MPDLFSELRENVVIYNLLKQIICESYDELITVK